MYLFWGNRILLKFQNYFGFEEECMLSVWTYHVMQCYAFRRVFAAVWYLPLTFLLSRNVKKKTKKMEGGFSFFLRPKFDEHKMKLLEEDVSLPAAPN